MSKGEFLLEVRCEEIPARMLRPALKELGTRLFEELMSRGMGPREVVTGATPRRLVLALEGLPNQEPDRSEQLLGPPTRVAWDQDGNPTPALLGFSRKAGVPPERLQRVTNAKGEYLSAVRTSPGLPTVEVLSEIVPRLLVGLKWPKTMRWGSSEGPWVRPVHGVVALFEGEVVPFSIFGIPSGNSTCGHPVLSPQPFLVDDWRSYTSALEERGLVVAFKERRRRIVAGLAERVGAIEGRLVDDPALLDKLTAMCEIPGVISGTFDEVYLDLPREVLVTALRDHQSAFTVESDDEELLPVFLTVMDRGDDPAGRVQAGNEWVVDARLADARFFLDEDRKTPLAGRRDRLSHLTFHVALGSYADKTSRLESLAAGLCRDLSWDDLGDSAVEAASLLKSDLDTEMVKEFTSLQGVVGGVYARGEGYAESVWRAIYDQYQPSSGDDPIPRDRTGRIVGLVDRIDTLVGMFGIGLAPTGSKDPFGLRRAAQGVVRIVMEGGLTVDLESLIRSAVVLYGDRLQLDAGEIGDLLRPFLHDRVRHLLGARGFAYDEVAAVLAVQSRDLPDLEARVAALHQARNEKGFLSVVLAAKRIFNIIRDVEEHTFDPDALVEPAAIDLHRASQGLKDELLRAESDRDYAGGLMAIATLADTLDRFFVEVMVMDEDLELRHNRIALLQTLHRLLSRTAQLTEMVVDRSDLRSPGGQDQNTND